MRESSIAQLLRVYCRPLGNWPRTAMWEASNGIVETQADSGRDRCWQSFLDPTDVWIGRVSAWLPMVSKRGDKELAQGSGVELGRIA